MEIIMYEIKITKLSETRLEKDENGQYFEKTVSDPSEWIGCFHPIVVFEKFLEVMGCNKWSSYPELMREGVIKEDERAAIYKCDRPFEVDDVIEYTLRHRKHIFDNREWARVSKVSMKSDGRYSFCPEIPRPWTPKDRIIMDFEIAVKEVVDNA